MMTCNERSLSFVGLASEETGACYFVPPWSKATRAAVRCRALRTVSLHDSVGRLSSMYRFLYGSCLPSQATQYGDQKCWEYNAPRQSVYFILGTALQCNIPGTPLLQFPRPLFYFFFVVSGSNKAAQQQQQYHTQANRRFAPTCYQPSSMFLFVAIIFGGVTWYPVAVFVLYRQISLPSPTRCLYHIMLQIIRTGGSIFGVLKAVYGKYVRRRLYQPLTA